MSDYSKATNFTTKDTLPTGNSGKIVKGTELDTEFTAISSAIASKADISSPSLLGTPTAPTATTGSNTTQLANTAYVKQEITAQGLGNIATQAKSAVEITGGTMNGVTGTNSGMTVGNATAATNATTVTNGVYTTNFSGSNQSKASSGYQKLPGGVIIQWGTSSTISAGSSLAISFPTAFPSSVGTIQLTAINPSPDNAVSAPQVTGPTTNGFTAVNRDPDSDYTVYWFAVGW